MLENWKPGADAAERLSAYTMFRQRSPSQDRHDHEGGQHRLGAEDLEDLQALERDDGAERRDDEHGGKEAPHRGLDGVLRALREEPRLGGGEPCEIGGEDADPPDGSKHSHARDHARTLSV